MFEILKHLPLAVFLKQLLPAKKAEINSADPDQTASEEAV